MSIDIDFQSVYLVTFGTCLGDCLADGSNACPSCKARASLEVRAMHQPCESTILFPPALFGNYISAIPQPFYVYVMYYMTLMDHVQMLCNPEIKIQFKSNTWHSNTLHVRRTAKKLFDSKISWMSDILKEMMEVCKTQADVLNAYEKCIFMGVSIIKEVQNVSSQDINVRIMARWKDMMDTMGTRALVECPCELYGQVKYVKSCEINDSWNADRSQSIANGLLTL